VRNFATGIVTRYRTKRLISNIGADAVQGRGTRVWEVRKLSDRNHELEEPLVLKDAWIDDDRMSEGSILREIHNKDGVGDNLHKLLDKYFLHVEDDGQVYIRDVLDHTREVMLKGHMLPDQCGSIPVLEERRDRNKATSSLQVQGAIVIHAPEPKKPPQYSGKVHYRIVYKEFGKTIREVESMSEAFKYLSGVAEGEHSLAIRYYILTVSMPYRTRSSVPTWLDSP
jgi:hypothetical protein